MVKEKLLQTMRRVEEERIQNSALKLDLRQAHKALQLELGEDVPITKVRPIRSGLGTRVVTIAIANTCHATSHHATPRQYRSSTGQRPTGKDAHKGLSLSR